VLPALTRTGRSAARLEEEPRRAEPGLSVGGFVVRAANASCVNEVSDWSAHARSCTKPGRMRRVHLSGPENILKRPLIQVSTSRE
jgi:hypothetical protein